MGGFCLGDNIVVIRKKDFNLIICLILKSLGLQKYALVFEM